MLNPATVRYFLQKAVLDIGEISVAARWLRYMNRDGEIADEKPCAYRFSSYNALYRGLLNCFDADKYHLGEAIIGFDQDDDGVQVSLASGHSESCDLLVRIPMSGEVESLNVSVSAGVCLFESVRRRLSKS